MTDASPLPGVLAEIEEIAGREAALALALHLGGAPLHIPKAEHVRPGHPLAEVMGAKAARVIAARFQGENVDIPLAQRALVVHLAAGGLSTKEIARKLRITVQAVRRYRSQTGKHVSLNTGAAARHPLRVFPGKPTPETGGLP